MLAEVVAQPNLLASIVDKLRIERKLLVEVLIDLDLLQHGRKLIAGVLAGLLITVAGDLGMSRRERGAQRRTEREPH
jgi:hypothetical protein